MHDWPEFPAFSSVRRFCLFEPAPRQSASSLSPAPSRRFANQWELLDGKATVVPNGIFGERGRLQSPGNPIQPYGGPSVSNADRAARFVFETAARRRRGHALPSDAPQCRRGFAQPRRVLAAHRIH
jgi:hypothetical protein